MTRKETFAARPISMFVLLSFLALFTVAQAGFDLAALAVAGSKSTPQGKQSRGKKRDRSQDREEKEKAEPLTKGDAISARPVMWQEPVDIQQRDLFYGAGGREGAPDPAATYTYIRPVKSGTQLKVVVKDNLDREWTVKFGPEARPETTASRIVWAVGYHVDQDYFVKRAVISGQKSYDARDVRFERRDDGYKEVDNWRWSDNPFNSTRELDGLKTLMALLKNWDLKTDNNKIMRHKKQEDAIYYVSDLGATLGRTGSWLNKIPIFANLPADKSGAKHAKGDPVAFSDEKFIDKVRDGKVSFHSQRSGPRRIFKGVTVSHAQWIGNLLGRLSDKQLKDAFRAGGFNDAEVELYARTLRAHIEELQNLDDFTAMRPRRVTTCSRSY